MDITKLPADDLSGMESAFAEVIYGQVMRRGGDITVSQLIAAGSFFLLPVLAFSIGMIGFWRGSLRRRDYLLAGLSVCVLAPVIAPLLGSFASTGDGSNWESDPRLNIYFVTLGNSLLGGLVVLLVAGIDKMAEDD